MPIHPTAIVHPSAEVDPGAEIGPYVVIDGHVRIAEGVVIQAHARLTGWTEVARGVRIHPFVSIGDEPQDRGYTGAETYCRIGADTILREGVSIHRGTPPGSATVIGERCMLMNGAHVAHNGRLADDVTLAAVVMLGGHVQVGPRAFIGGLAGVHQFGRIGELAMVAGGAGVSRDIPPFMLTDRDGHVAGLNVVGMRRAGIGREERAEIQAAYKLLYRSGLHFRDALTRLPELIHSPPGRRLLEFVSNPSKRNFAGPARRSPAAEEEARD